MTCKRCKEEVVEQYRSGLGRFWMHVEWEQDIDHKVEPNQ